MTTRLLALRNEQGSALVIALAFVTIVSLFLASILSFNATSFLTTSAVRSQRDAVYAADGAIQGAIQKLRSDGTLGRDDGVPCPDFVMNGLNEQDVRVACDPSDNSGVVNGLPASASNTPKNAVLTLSTAETGLNEGSVGTLRVTGSVFSHSSIKTNANGYVVVNGAGNTVTARTICVGNITPACIIIGTSASAPSGNDPNWGISSIASATPPAVQSQASAQAACNKANAFVQFTPGTYNDAVGLNSLMRSTSTCNKGLFYFEPGVYYFDFTNTGSHSWDISGANIDVVGGIPKDWAKPTPLSGPRPNLPATFACKGHDDGPGDGVQFIFGGDSRMSVTDARVELCARRSQVEQNIAIYGLKNNSTAPATTVTAVPTTNSAVSGFVNPTAAYAIGEAPIPLTSDFITATTNKAKGGTITLGGFSTAGIPAGSTINSVGIRIAHRETNVSDLSLKFTSGANSTTFTNGPCATATNLCIGPNQLQTLPLSTATYNTVEKLAGATIAFEATVPKNITSGGENLDGVALDVTYTPPVYRAQSLCLLNSPYTEGGSNGTACSLLTTRGSQTKLTIQGTVYAPKSAIDLELTNDSTEVIRRGVVARTVWVKPTGSSTFAGSAIEIPAIDPATSTDREVTLQARINGALKLEALVQIVDTPATGFSVVIKRWKVVRA